MRQINRLMAQTTTSGHYFSGAPGIDVDTQVNTYWDSISYAMKKNQTEVNEAIAKMGWSHNSIQFNKDVFYLTSYAWAGAALGLTFLVLLCILPVY